MGKPRICIICGKRFIQENSNTKPIKYCSEECREVGRSISQKKAHERRRKQRKAENNIKKIEKSNLDKTLAEAREKGLSYAELQKQKTLEKIRNGEL